MFVSHDWGFQLLFSLNREGPGQLERERRPIFPEHSLGEPFPHGAVPPGFQDEAVNHSEDGPGGGQGNHRSGSVGLPFLHSFEDERVRTRGRDCCLSCGEKRGAPCEHLGTLALPFQSSQHGSLGTCPSFPPTCYSSHKSK